MQSFDFVLRTDYPVASNSVDHEFPHGTAKDNTHWLPFVEACEKIFDTRMAVLDLGCSGGGLVYDFFSRKHNAYGLEGSDFSLKHKRAEWGTIPDRLFTCDLTKPFEILSGSTGSRMQFDVIMAWDLLEHIPEPAVPQLFATVVKQLSKNGIFVGSISTRPASLAPDGRNYHSTVKNRKWWMDQFKAAGFSREEHHLFKFEDYPRGNGNNYPANFAENPESGFHFCVRS